MKFALEIKTEPVTRAAIVVAVVAFSSGSLAMIAFYTNSPTARFFCTGILANVVYLALNVAKA
jgi:hypothetical protein